MNSQMQRVVTCIPGFWEEFEKLPGEARVRLNIYIYEWKKYQIEEIFMNYKFTEAEGAILARIVIAVMDQTTCSFEQACLKSKMLIGPYCQAKVTLDEQVKEAIIIYFLSSQN